MVFKLLKLLFLTYLLCPIFCLLFFTSCSTKPLQKDDPDFWIYKLENYKKDAKNHIEDILNIYNRINHDLVKIYSISLLKDYTDIQKVLNLLISELSNENDKVKIEAIRALGKKGLDSATNKLIEILYQNVESQIKVDVCNSLSKIGDKRAIPPLIDMLNSKDNFIVFSCSYALHVITGIPLENGKTIKLPSVWLNKINPK